MFSPSLIASPESAKPHPSEGSRVELITLPDHLQLRITSHLDRTSAISLAQTCRAIQAAAESSAWKELNISVQRSFLPLPPAYEWTKPLGGHWLYKIRQATIWHEGTSGESMRKQREAMRPYVISLIEHLKRHGQWVRSVRTIYLDSDAALAGETCGLIDLVAGTLVRLELVPHGLSLAARPDRALFSLRQTFCGLRGPLSKLRHLQLPLGPDWATSIQAVLPKTPYLRFLRLTALQPYSGSWDETATYSPASPTISWPILPLLRELEVDEISPSFTAMLTAVVKAAPDLRYVGIRDPTRSWQPDTNDELLAQLGRAGKLEYLGVPRVCCLAITQPHTFPSLEELSTADDRRAWGVTHLEVTHGFCIALTPVGH